MNIIEAIKSDKPFKRKSWRQWRVLSQREGFVVGSILYELILEDDLSRSGYTTVMFDDVLADDWEIKP